MIVMQYELLLLDDRLYEIASPLIRAGLITLATLEGEKTPDTVKGLTLVVNYERPPHDSTSAGFIFGRATPESEIEVVTRREGRLKLQDVEKVCRLEIEGAKLAEKLLAHLTLMLKYRDQIQQFFVAVGMVKGAGIIYGPEVQRVLAKLFLYIAGVEEYLIGERDRPALVQLYNNGVFETTGPYTAQIVDEVYRVTKWAINPDMPRVFWQGVLGQSAE